MNLLEADGPASKLFESNGLMIFEVKPAIEQSCMNLEEMSACQNIEDDATSNLNHFQYNGSKDAFTVKMKAPGDGLQKEKKYSYMDMSYINKLWEESIMNAFS